MTVVIIGGLLSLIMEVKSFSESKGAGLVLGLKENAEALGKTHR